MQEFFVIVMLLLFFSTPVLMKFYVKKFFAMGFPFFRKRENQVQVKPNKLVKYNEEIAETVTMEEERLEYEKRKNEELEKLLTRLYGEIREYKQKEHDDRITKMRLENSKNAIIVNQQIKSQGKLICFEGTSSYQEMVSRKGFLNKKINLNIDLNYNFGIAMDWSTIEVVRVNDTTMQLKLPKDRLFIQYVELVSDNSTVESNKTIFVRDFEPEYINEIIKKAEDQIRLEINTNIDYFEKAYNNLKYQILEFASKIGCNTITF